MNVKLMSNDILRQEQTLALQDAQRHSMVAHNNDQYALTARRKSNGYFVSALGIAGVVLYMRHEQAPLDADALRDLRMHYQGPCTDDAKDTLKGKFSALNPTPHQTALITKCVDEYVTTHTAKQPVVDFVATSVALAFVGAAFFQRYKSSYCLRKKAENLEQANVSHAFSDVCYRELRERLQQLRDLRL